MCSSAQSRSESLAVQTSRATRQHIHTTEIPKANLVLVTKLKQSFALLRQMMTKRLSVEAAKDVRRRA